MNQPPQSSSRSSRFFSWRNLRRALIGLAILVTLVGLLITFENVRGKRAWEAHRAQLLAQGEKLTIAELAPPPVPDDQNFALTPLLKAALDFTREASGPVWRDTNALNRLNQMNPSRPSDSAATNRLSPGNFDRASLTDLDACARFYLGNSNYPQATVSTSSAERILVALGAFDSEVAELEKAAAERPHSRFPIDYGYEPSIAILLPHLAHLKGLSSLLQLRVTAALEAGLTNRAFSELQVAMRLSDSISGEPILIDHLVRIATVAISLQTLREGLARHAWNDAQLTALEKQLGTIDLLTEYQQAMRGERGFSVGTLDYMRRQRFQLKLSDFADDVAGDGRAASLMPAGWFYQNMLTISRMHQDFVLTVVDEKAHRVLVDRVKELDRETDNLGRSRFKPYKIFAALLFPALSKATIKTARMQMQVGAGQVACALERYRLANGKFPETLEALIPRFIEKIPTDVIDGKPLRYRLAPDRGYVLYSVGWNQTDDGGEPAWKTDKERSLDLTKGDWVWQMPTR